MPMTKKQPIQLQFYTKPDCPLCDKAKTILRQVGQKIPIQVEEIDITANLGLFTKYKNLIPVLEMDGKRLFVYRIDGRKLRRKLALKRLRMRFRL
jgi:glutaredoxin